jgi:arylsulfatase A-like enzyme
MDRREFLRAAGAVGGAMALGGARSTLSGAGAAGMAMAGVPPIRNVLFLVTDQHRADCLGCYGNGIVRTPNIDRLAATGVRFTNAFSPTPTCAPARACILTGLRAHRHGLYFNPEYQPRNGGRQDPEPSARFFSEDLKEAGWNLAHNGKWHIGTERTKASSRGFEAVDFPLYGFPGELGDGSIHPHYKNYLQSLGVDGFKVAREVRSPDGLRVLAGVQEGPEAASEAGYLEWMTADTIRRFGRQGRPFFVACDFWGPHGPFYLPERYAGMYKGRNIPAWPNFDAPLADKPGVLARYGEYWKTGWFTPKVLSGLLAWYFGYITMIDDAVGRIVEALREAGRLDETLIVMTADHGDSAGAYRFWDKGFGMYDCLTRVPMIASHPSLQSRVEDAFVTLVDLAPTVLDVAGIAAPRSLDGRSLLPLLRGDAGAKRDDFVVVQGFGHQLPYWQRMIRTRTAKYVLNATDHDEYYDLASDPWEMRNIADSVDPSAIKEMRGRLKDWIDRNADPIAFWADPLL